MAKNKPRRKTGYTKRLTPQQFQGKLKKAKTLPEFLALVHDSRRGQGKVHNLTTVLLIVLMATMSGYHGQRATGDFVTKHQTELINILHPKDDKLPSYQTIARIMQHLDYEQLATMFLAWTKTVIRIEDKDWLSMDGKGINGTVEASGTARQRYTNLVSVFVQKTKQVLAQGKVGNKTNEIPLVARLVKEVGLTGLVFTADALHCQKETVKAIIESGNDYCIGVKGNQPKLLAALKKTPAPPLLAAI